MASRIRFLRYIRSYHSNSIFFRNLALIMLLVTVPLVILGIFSFQYNRNILDDEIRKANSRSLLKFQGSIDVIQGEIERISAQMINSQNVVKFLRSDLPEYPEYQQIESMQSIILDMNLVIHNYIHSILVYANHSNYVISNTGGGALWKWFDNTAYHRLTGPANEWLLDTQILPGEEKDATPKKYLTFYKGFTSAGKDQPVGKVAILLDVEKIQRFLYGQGGVEREIIFIVDSEGTVLFSSEFDWIGSQFSAIAEYRHTKAFNPESIDSVEYMQKPYVFSYIKSTVSDWTYCTILSRDVFFETQEILERIMVIATLFSVIVSIGTAFLISLYVFKPIHEVINMLENPRDIPDYESYDNELKFIAGNIMQNYDEYTQDRQEIENRAVMLNTARVRALQAQINPHFLNNTLQLANWMILKETQNEESEAIAVLENLADLVRVNMETKSNLISLADETDYVSKYMEIQKKRYGNKIRFRLSIPEELESVPVLKMMLQPIVENAIYHGLKKKPEAGIVTLGARREGDILAIEVEDNGRGMDIGEIDALNRELSTVDSLSDAHIGLTNVSLRLRLVFGSQSSIHLSSRRGGGIRVTVTIPIR